jgi:hypothetical protein
MKLSAAPLLVLFVSLMLLAGCTSNPTSSREYVCPDGSVVSSPSACPPQNSQSPTKEVTVEKIKYVCWDNSTVVLVSQCPPQPEKVTERTVEVTVNVTKYVCSNGNTVDDATKCPTPESVTEVKTFSGESADVTDQFYLKQGLVLITGHYVGSSNFIVQLIDSNGDNTDLIFNEIGDYDGKHATQIKKDGYYRLGVEGIVGWNKGGSWSVKIEQ